MYVVVEHDISNPQSFWATAQEGMSDLPGNLKLHHVLPDGEGKKAVCLWEGDSEDQVRSFVEDAVGNDSRNTYFAVNAENAIGLPAKATA